jgi:hypothetical protein
MCRSVCVHVCVCACMCVRVCVHAGKLILPMRICSSDPSSKSSSVAFTSKRRPKEWNVIIVIIIPIVIAIIIIIIHLNTA